MEDPSDDDIERRKKALFQNLGVNECFDEIFFTDGIATKSCYCCNEAGTKIYGYDEAEKGIVSIDFLNNMKRKTYLVTEVVLKSAKWLRILNISTGTSHEFLALLAIQSNLRLSLIHFKLSCKCVHLLNMNEISVGDYSENIANQYLLQTLTDPRRNFYVAMGNEGEPEQAGDRFIPITVCEIKNEIDGSINVNTMFDKLNLHVKELFFPTIHGNSIYFYDKSAIIRPDKGRGAVSALMTITLDESITCKWYDLYDHPVFPNDNVSMCPVLGSAQNEIFYFEYNETANSNLLLGINVNDQVVSQHFLFTEHPISTEMAVFSNERFILNGKCTRTNCHKWHTYHFVVSNSLSSSYSLNLRNIDLLFSPNASIVNCGSAPKSIIVILWLLRQIIKCNFREVNLYVKEESIERYISKLSTLNQIARERIQIVPIIDQQDQRIADVPFVVDHVTQIPFAIRIALSERTTNSFIILRNNVQKGLDHPRQWVKWFGVVSDYEPTANLTTIESPSALDIYYPEWELVLAHDDRSYSTILIPPCADIDKEIYSNRATSADSGRDAERHLIQQIMQQRIGGVFFTGLKGKEFMEAHGVKASSGFEIDALFVHAKYGLIVIECKAIKTIEKLHERILSAGKQLQKIHVELRKVYQHISITYVIALPNMTLNEKDKINFSKQATFSIWDSEDLQLDNLHLKLNAIKIQLNQDSSLTTLNHDATLKEFVQKTASYRSRKYISHQENALALQKIIDFQMCLKKANAYKKQSFYLSQEQERVFDDENNSHKIQIISGPPGTGKTLLIQLKALELAKRKNFDQKICVLSNVHGSVLQMRQFFSLNCATEDNMPYVTPHIFIPYEGALFVDELPVEGKLIEDIIETRKSSPLPTFLCITGSGDPSGLSQSMLDARLNGIPEVKHTFLNTVYRGTKNIIEYWGPIFNKNFSINIGHSIRGFEVEQYEQAKFIDMLDLAVEQIKQFRVTSSASENVSYSAVVAVIIENKDMLDITRAYISAAGIPCGTALEHAKNLRLIPVDEARNCLSMEWPVVIHMETGLGHVFLGDPFIAASRAIAKLVVIRRDFTKVADEFERIYYANVESQIGRNAKKIELAFDDFVALMKQAQENVYNGDINWYVEERLHFDVIAIVLRSGYWPLEMQHIPPFDCADFYDAIDKMNENEQMLLPIIFIAAYNTDLLAEMKEIWTNRSLPQNEDPIPKFLQKIWSSETVDVAKNRWQHLCELNENIKRFLPNVFVNKNAQETEILVLQKLPERIFSSMVHVIIKVLFYAIQF